MSYRKGMGRLLTAATLCWLAFTAILAYSGVFRSEPLTTPILVASIPPVLAYLVLLVVLPWIVAGFRSKT